MSDGQRVSGFDFAALNRSLNSEAEEKRSSPELVVLVGQAGTGMALVVANLSSQLADLLGADAGVSAVTIDFAMLVLSRQDPAIPASSDEVSRFVKDCFRQSQRLSAAGASKREVVVVAVVECAAQHVPTSSLLSLVGYLEGEVATVVSVLSPSTFSATEVR